ncbi:MAG TPA: CoA transferase [Solirubrobacteraceae bacterium]|nr:CoA transferase [Solirubrobacteraceae bacterium]
MSALASSLWASLGGEPGALRRLRVTDAGAWLGGPLAVDELAVGAVASALLAAGELARAGGGEPPEVELSGEHVALSFQSERHALRAGTPAGAGFAPLSRFVRCAEGGWARTHGNYPHHAAALLGALGLDADLRGASAVQALEAAALAREPVALEDAVAAAGGCAAAVRTAQQWRVHPTARALAGEGLISWHPGAVSAPRSVAGRGDPARAAAGVRVLDLTRVIAGPVAGRTLAALGAEVLRVDPPAMPELEAQHLDCASRCG